MARIVHIATDEKFINNAFWQFEQVYPGENQFYLLVANKEATLKYVHKENNMELITIKIQQLKELHKRFTEAVLICFHGLDYHSSIVLNHTPAHYKLLWIIWGFEVHNNPYLSDENEVLGKLSKEYFLLNRKNQLKKTFKSIFGNIWYRVKNNTQNYYAEITHAIKKADYCGIFYREEFDIIKHRIGTEIEQFIYSYYPIEKMVKDEDARVSGNHIMLGNSATITNNHLEAFELLNRFSLENRKVITPLSYGDDTYKKEILNKGKTYLGDNFSPLTEFMPLHEYNAYLEQCSIVIMNHQRQQAVGNILTMLWMGAKVFLDERNSFYHYLKRQGITVYSISEDLNPVHADVLEKLSEEHRTRNRRILKQKLNQDVLLKQLRIELDRIL